MITSGVLVSVGPVVARNSGVWEGVGVQVGGMAGGVPDATGSSNLAGIVGGGSGLKDDWGSMKIINIQAASSGMKATTRVVAKFQIKS